MPTTDTPPWDMNKVPKNPIDRKMLFSPKKGIFDMEEREIFYAGKHIYDDPNFNPETNKIESKKPPKPIIIHNHNEVISLAIKYRPRLFSELVGQESVAKTLSLALDSQKISHAYLFSGLRGSGKTSSARIFARCLQCEEGISSNPCGVCANCQAALSGNNMDIVELDGASNRKIDDIREIIEQTKYKPSMGRFKVFIIDEVHMLTKEAFNALLKTLEEPPSYVKFILATTDPLKVPPTILSRTQHYRFKQIATNALRNHLFNILQKEGVQYDTQSIDMIIRNGSGSARDTLTLLDQAIVFCEGNLTLDKVASMLGAFDISLFDVLMNALVKQDKQACIKFLNDLDGYETEMILDSLSLYIKDRLMQDRIMPIMAMRYANIIVDSKALLQMDCDGEFCLLLTILKMLEAQKIHDIESIIQQIEKSGSIDINALKDSIDLTKSMPRNSGENNNTQPLQADITNSSLRGDVAEEAIHNNASKADSNNKDYHSLQEESSIANPNLQIHNNNLQHDTNTSSLRGDVAEEAIHNNNKNTANIESKIDSISQTIHNENKQIDSINPPNNNETINKSSNPQYIKYKDMVKEISKRDFNTGEIFETSIEFDRIDSQFLYLISYANEEQNLVLRHAYKGILEIAQSIFGNIKIKVDKRDKPLQASKAMDNNLQNENNISSDKPATSSLRAGVAEEAIYANSNKNNTNIESKIDSINQATNNTNKQIDYSDSMPRNGENPNLQIHNKNTTNIESKPKKPLHFSQDNLGDFIDEHKAAIDTFKNGLGISAVKVIDYKQ